MSMPSDDQERTEWDTFDFVFALASILLSVMDLIAILALAGVEVSIK